MRTAILLSAPYDPTIRQAVQEGRHPQPDYLALADRLGATLLTPVRVGQQPRHPLKKALGFLRIAWTGFRRRHDFDVIISDVDRVGLLLAALLKLTRSPQRHVVICHGKLTQQKDALLIKALRLHTHLHHIVCYGPEATSMLTKRVPVLKDRVTVVWHGADHHFWRPQGEGPERLIVSAGLLRRDFATLMEAVRGLDVAVEVAAHSPWVTNGGGSHAGVSVPANVRFQRHDYAELRRLYDRALLVAVPLMPTQSQAGSLVVYEAMAMGKPVIVTMTDGQASMGLIKDGRSGFYVEPGDVERWRQLIQHLLDHPDQARAIGQRARAAVEAGLNMEVYAEQVAQVLASAPQIPEALPSRAVA